MSGSSATPTPPLSLAEMQVLVSRAGLTLNPGQMADLVLAWRQVVALLASIPRDRPLVDDQAFVFRLPPPPSATPARPAVSISAPPAIRSSAKREAPKRAAANPAAAKPGAARPAAAKPAPKPNAGKRAAPRAATPRAAKPKAAKAKAAKAKAAKPAAGATANRTAKPAAGATANRTAKPAAKQSTAHQPAGKQRAANKPAAKPAARAPSHPTRTKVRSLSSGGTSARPVGRR
jgi:hypothetical protein